MSTISLITFLTVFLSTPTYTEFFQDKDTFFYRQNGNFYTITNLSDGKKTLGVKTPWGNCYIRIFKINTEKLKLAGIGLSEVKKEISKNKFKEDDYTHYEKILNSTEYSDSLAYIFLCWRTSYQMANYGVSNFSYIPNNFYNRKKKNIINKLKLYLESHPDSKIAAQQIAYLQNLSDIVRGGFMGSSVLNDLVFLSKGQ